jgi:hypothetical protein
MGWQDDPIAGEAPAAAAPAATPAWMSHPEAPAPAPAAAPALESNAEADWRKLKEGGYQPPGWLDAFETHVGVPFKSFTEQMQRALTFGLSDKVAAAVPAINASVARAARDPRTFGREGTPPPEDTPIGALIAETPSFSDVYHEELARQRGFGEAYAENHPVASKVATTLGTVASIPVSGAAKAVTAPTLAGRVAQGAGQGAIIGGISGYGNSNDQGLGETALDVGQGAAAGTAIGAASPVVAEKVISPAVSWFARTPLGQWVVSKFGGDAIQSQAVRQVAQRMSQDASGGGPGAQDVLDLLSSAPPGKPLAPIDFAGENVRGRGGAIARQPGEGRQVLTSFLNDRDVGAGARLASDVDSNISSGGSAFETSDALMKARSAASGPAYDQAFQGGSTAPLVDQLRDSLQAATGAKGQIAKQIAQIERDSPGALASRGAAGADIRANYMQLHQDLAQAEQDRVATLSMFKRAQGDASANAPGAVWNPRIQQFLDDPVFQGGLSRGMQIQRLEALSQGKPFNPTEYAVTGADAAGKPIIGAVPNMRLLDAGKKGLDAIIQDNRDSVTGRLNEMGRAVDMVRGAYLKQLDAVNPSYAAARAAWSGPSASLDAVRAGQGVFLKDPAEIAHEFGQLAPNDQEFYRLGAADALKKSISKTGMGGDEAKRIIGNQYTQNQLRPLFPTSDAYDNFIGAATAENRMFNTRFDLLRGSQTAGRVAEDAGHASGAMGHAMQGAVALGEGAPVAATLSGVRALRSLIGNAGESPEVNAAVARMLTSTDPAANRAALASVLAAQNAPSRTPMVSLPLAAAMARAYPDLRQLPYVNQSAGQ